MKLFPRIPRLFATLTLTVTPALVGCATGDGAAYKLDPPLVVLRLEPVPAPASAAPAEGKTQ